MTQLEYKTPKKKTRFWILALILLLFGGIGSWYFFAPHSSENHVFVQEDDYTCPMHQQVHSDKPGNCPICGMKLVKRSSLHTVSKSSGGSSNLQGVMFSQLSAVKANISVTKVERRILHNELRLPGTIEIAEPNEQVITARTRGRIEKLFVKETGGYIKAGMPLYQYYSPDLSANVAQYIIAKNAQVHSADHYHGGASLNMEQAARERLKLYGLTDAEINQYSESTSAPQTFTIYASASGTIIKKDVVEGAWFDEGTTLFQIAELSTVWANFDIPQDALGSVHIGQSVSVTVSSYANLQFTGKVIFISPVLNESTRTARIRVLLANPASKLKVQMAIEGQIIIASETALTVPASAVAHTGDDNIVWVKRSDGMFYPQKIILGFRDNEDNYAVISGVEEGDIIASSGTFLIDSEHQLKTNSLSMPGMDMKKEKPSEEKEKPAQSMPGMKMQ